LPADRAPPESVDVRTCATEKVFALPDSHATQLEVSRDGRFVATSGDDGTITLFDTRAHEVRSLGKHGTYAYTVVFSPDSRYLATGGVDRMVRLVDLSDPTHVVAWPGHLKAVVRLAFTPDSKTLISAARDTNVFMWDVATGAGRLVRGHDKDVSDMHVSPDGTTLATSSADGTVRLWPIRTRSQVPAEPEAVARFIREATSAEIDAQSSVSSP
jgi:WD40 repeat protein